MLTNVISPGDKLDLESVDEVQLADGTVGKKKYKTTVFDVISDDRIEIMMPMDKTKLILLPVDGEYDVCFYTKNGMFQCYVKIIERYKNDKYYILVVEPTSNLRKFQRREYYRFGCVLEMQTRVLKEEEVEAIGKDLGFLVPNVPLRRAIIVDISGGGMRFISKDKYEVGSKLYCKYVLNSDNVSKEYNLVGKVLHSDAIENRDSEYEHRVEFSNIDNIEREEIIKYIFDEERKNRKKDKGR